MSAPARNAVIEEEQAAVDAALRAVARRVVDDIETAEKYRKFNGMPPPGGLGSPGRADDGPPLVVLHVDTRDGESYRIGRTAVWDDQRNLVVISSAAQAAINWRLATMRDPGEVLLRRLLRYRDPARNRVGGYLDEISPSHGSDPAPAAGKPKPGPRPRTSERAHRGEQRPEARDPLLDELNRARNGVMRDIVETVQREQLLTLSDDRPGMLVVQGGPGTGKTAVGLYRVMWLIDNGHCAAKDLMVVGPRREFLRYVGEVLPTLGGKDITVLSLDQFWDGKATGTDSPAARQVKADDRMADVLRRAVDASVRPERSQVQHLLDGTAFRFTLRQRSYRVDGEELLRPARELRRAAGPFTARRAQFADRVVDVLLAAVQGRAKRGALDARDTALRRELRGLPEVRAFIDYTWQRISAKDVLRLLLTSPQYLAQLSPLLTDDERAAVLRPVSEQGWTEADLVLLDELDSLLNGSIPRTYRHLIVDEAQDLTPMQARALARRCPGGWMTVLGDLAQATGPYRYSGWRELAQVLGTGNAWQTEVLPRGYRLPREVMEFVAPLAKAVAPRVPSAAPVRPAGLHPVRVLTATADALTADAAQEAVDLVARYADQRRSVAVLVPDGGPWRDEITLLTRAAPGAAAPVVLTASAAKGLEFDHTVVVEPAQILDDDPVGGGNRLYIALTRCTQSLTVIHSRPLPTELVQEGAGTT